jgi:hypothetical protein
MCWKCVPFRLIEATQNDLSPITVWQPVNQTLAAPAADEQSTATGTSSSCSAV